MLQTIEEQFHQTPKKIRTFFLLQFTRELIKHAGASEVFELENVLNKEFNFQKQSDVKNKIHETIKERKKVFNMERKNIQDKKPIFRFPAKVKRVNAFESFSQHHVQIPEPKLPLRFQYLKPTLTNVQIDLEKLNALVKDPLVKLIKCNGADENIIVEGSMGIKPTNIILTKQEIDSLIKKFSETAKIPIHEGVFRVVAGKLILLAIISEVIKTKFIIKKIMHPRNPIHRF